METKSLPLVGSRYLLDASEYETITTGSTIGLRNLETRRYLYLTPSDFTQLVKTHKITLKEKAPLEISDAVILASLSDHRRSIYTRRRTYVRACLERLHGCLSRDKTLLVIDETAKLINDSNPPSYTTLYNWSRRYKSNNLNPLALLNKHGKHRNARTSEVVNEFITKYLQEQYLRDTRPSLSLAYRLMCGHIHYENEKLDITFQKPITPPSYSTFRRRLKKIDGYSVCQARFGKDHARLKFKYKKEDHEYGGLYDNAQGDTHILDILIVNDDGEIIGKPTLFTIINTRTRVILGWDISIGASNAEKAIRAIKMALTGKGNEYPTGGKFSQLTVDNGSETMNTWIINIMETLGINLIYAPPKSSDSKANIERFFRTIESGIIHALPGTVKSNPIDRGDYPSEKKACFTLDQIKEIFSQWLNIYHTSYHSSLNTSPYEYWEQQAKNSPPPENYSEEDLELLCLNRVFGSIQSGCVKRKRLLWSGPGLAEIAYKLSKTQKAVIYINPCDLAKIWVAHPDTPQDWHPAYATNPKYQNGLTLSEHELILEIERENKKSFDERPALKHLYQLFTNLPTQKKRQKRHPKESSAQQESTLVHPKVSSTAYSTINLDDLTIQESDNDS